MEIANMAIEAPVYPLLSGNLQAAILDTSGLDTGFFELGNFTVKAKRNTDLKELPSVMNADYGANKAAVYIPKGSDLTLEGDGITADVLALLFSGSVADNSVTGATIQNESHTLKSVDKSVQLAFKDISTIAIAKSTIAAVAGATTQDTGDTITETTHGLTNGQVVFFTAIATTTGIVINTPYYIVGSAANTFQVSLTSGGAALPLTTDGTVTYRVGLNPDSYSLINARLGMIALLSTGTTPSAIADIVEISYTYATKTSKLITAGTSSSVNLHLVGDLEDQNTGELWVLDVPKITVASDSEIELIGTEFMKVTLVGKPISVNGAGDMTLLKNVA